MEVKGWVCRAILQYEDDVCPAVVWGTSLETLQIKNIKTDVVLLSEIDFGRAYQQNQVLILTATFIAREKH